MSLPLLPPRRMLHRAPTLRCAHARLLRLARGLEAWTRPLLRPACLRLAPLALAVLALAFTSGCSAPSGPRPAPADPDDAQLARRPYDAGQIAAAMPLGSWRCYRVDQQDREPLLQTTTVTAADAQGVRLAMQLQTIEEQDVGTPQSMDAAWQELMEHASFPRSATTIEDVQLEVPAGEFDCWLYTVSRQDGEVAVVERYHFAKRLPGPPVRYESLRGGESVYVMTLRALGQR